MPGKSNSDRIEVKRTGYGAWRVSIGSNIYGSFQDWRTAIAFASLRAPHLYNHYKWT